MSFVKYPSIEQYRNVVKSVSEYYKHKYGQRDENGDLILAQPKTWTLPKVTFTGTVKLHGSNGAIVYNVEKKTLDFQSRNNTLNLQNDNAEFAYWGHQNREALTEFMERILGGFRLVSPEHFHPEQMVIFGEWCGGNIQKGVGISGLPKMFVIFEAWIQIKTGDEENPTYNWHLSVKNMNISIPTVYKITDFKTYEMEIDFENPALVQNDLSALTMEVEEDCPVARVFKKQKYDGIVIKLVNGEIVSNILLENEILIKVKQILFSLKGEGYENPEITLSL